MCGIGVHSGVLEISAGSAGSHSPHSPRPPRADPHQASQLSSTPRVSVGHSGLKGPPGADLGPRPRRGPGDTHHQTPHNHTVGTDSPVGPLSDHPAPLNNDSALKWDSPGLRAEPRASDEARIGPSQVLLEPSDRWRISVRICPLGPRQLPDLYQQLCKCEVASVILLPPHALGVHPVTIQTESCHRDATECDHGGPSRHVQAPQLKSGNPTEPHK